MHSSYEYQNTTSIDLQSELKTSLFYNIVTMMKKRDGCFLVNEGVIVLFLDMAVKSSSHCDSISPLLFSTDRSTSVRLALEVVSTWAVVTGTFLIPGQHVH